MMDPAELDEAAHALYDACPSIKPRWEQLGDVTKSVWRDRVTQNPTAKVEPPKPIGHMDSLF